MVAYFEDGIGQFGLIYDVMRDHLFTGVEDSLFIAMRLNWRPLWTNLWKTFWLLQMSACLRKMTGAWPILVWILLAFGSTEVPVLVFKILSGGILAYFSYIWPWDYAAAAIMGEQLGYTVLNLNGDKPNYQSVEPIMMVPKVKLTEIQTYLKKGRS